MFASVTQVNKTAPCNRMQAEMTETSGLAVKFTG